MTTAVRPPVKTVTPARNAPAKRAAILGAARVVFAEKGFDKATIREIGRRAGVAASLVLQHFGAKEELFLAAVTDVPDLTEHVAGNRRGLPERVARAFLTRMESGDRANSFVALVRAAADGHGAAREMVRAMWLNSLPAYQAVLGGDDVEQRLEWLAAVLAGVSLSRYATADGPLAGLPSGEVIRHLTIVLRAVLLDGKDIETK